MIPLSHYLHTLRYLKPIQIFGRIWFWVHRPAVRATSAPPVRRSAGRWQQSPPKPHSLLSASRFRFLNEEHGLSSAADWNNPAWGKLWLYNLHYFDDLNAEGGEERLDWHRALIARWVAENPVGLGNGWEPYPLSLRIVNWVKWAWAGSGLPPAAIESLALQARFLRRRLPGKPVHRREWRFSGHGLQIRDRIEGPFREAAGYLHFHPDLQLTPTEHCRGGRISLPDGRAVHWRIVQGRARLVDATWHPEFGKTIPNQCLEIRFDSPETIVQIAWGSGL